MLVVWLMMGVVATNPIFEEDGVLVHQDGDVRRVGAAWSVVVIIEPPLEMDITNLDAGFRTAFTQAEARFGEGGAALWERKWAALKHLFRRHTRGLDEEELHMDYNNRRVRVKRGWFNFVGAMVRPLFNIPDFTDIEALRKLIMGNNNRQHIMKHHTMEMVSMINATRALVQLNADHIDMVQNLSLEALKEVEMNREAQAEDFQAIAGLVVARALDEAVHEAESAITSYIAALKDYHLKKVEMERGWLTENIITELQLLDIMGLIEKRGFEALPVLWYFQYVAVIPIWEAEDHLAFRVVLPAVDKDMFIKYSILYVPVPFGPDHMRIIEGEGVVVLHTMTKASFIPINCLGKLPNVCWPEVELLQNSCEYQLVNGNVPRDCKVRIFKTQQEGAYVRKVSPLDSSVVVAPPKGGQHVTLRCVLDPPVKLYIDKPTVLPVRDGCVLGADKWKIRAVVHVHESLRLPVREPIALPKLNISWPKKVKAHVQKVLKLVGHVRVPLIDVEKWAKEDQDAEARVALEGMQWGEMVSHPYVAAGSSGMAVLICGIVLLVNVYCFCCSGKMKMLARVTEVVNKRNDVEASAPLVQVSHHMPNPMMDPRQPAVVNMAPPPPYPTLPVAMAMEPGVSVTLSPEQIARLIGFTPRRALRAMEM